MGNQRSPQETIPVGHLVEFRGPDILRVMTYRDPADAFRALTA